MARHSELEESVLGFSHAMRRQDDTAAMAFVRPSKQAEFYKNMEQFENMRISNVEVHRVFPNGDMEEALVGMNFEVYRPDQAELMSFRRFYNWTYDSSDSRWYLEENNPFGRSSEGE